MRLSDLSLVNTVATALAGPDSEAGPAEALALLERHGVRARLYLRDEYAFRPMGDGDAIATVSAAGRALAAGEQAGAAVPLRFGGETVGALEIDRSDEVGRELCVVLREVFALALAGRQPRVAAADTTGARETALLEAVLDSVGDGLLLYAGDSFRANAAAQRMLGISGHEIPPPEAFAPRHLDGTPLAPEDYPARKAHETGEPEPYRYLTRLLDGTERVFAGTVSPILMPDGADLGTVVLFRDVTDEHERELLTQRFLEQLIASLPTAIAVSEPTRGELLSVNQAYLDLVGRTLDDVVGRKAPYPWWETSFDEDSTAEGPVRVEGVFRHADGQLVPVEVTRIFVRGTDGAPQRSVVLVTDLSERRRFEQQLAQSGKLAAIGELAAGVAHEINNPLFAILGLVEFLLKDAEPGTKAHSRLTLIQETGLEIKEIVRALLDFARERSDDFRVVSLNEVVLQAAELLRRTSAAKRVQLIERVCDEPLHVNGSPSQLKQILLNLVTNAGQAMPDGGSVTIEVERDGEQAVVTVSDTGPGIAPDELPRIFDPFFTTKRDLGGTGLGLSVSLGIAEMHGGGLTAASIVGEGSVFRLTLPLVEEDS